MTALELFNEGRLTEALALQRQAVRDAAGDPDAHLLFCELLVCAGDIDEARRQLEALPVDSRDWHEFIEDYQLLLDAEAKRQRVIRGELPVFLGEPPPHALYRLEAIQLIHDGNFAEASGRLDAADEESPDLSGHVDGREFDGLRDGDDRFASVFEVLVDDQFAWIPMEQVRRLRLAPIESIRDQLFVPARLALCDGSRVTAHLPTLYVGSNAHASEAVRSGRETDWLPCGEGFVRGAGLRVFSVGEQEEVTPWELTQFDLRDS